MRWTTDILEKRAKIYNRIYFNNEIEKPIVIRWSRHLFNSKSNTHANERYDGDRHVITFNVLYSNASNEAMRNTLVHEMIHAWQDEHDDTMRDNWKELEGHGPAFVKKCEELSSKFKFTYPLTRYVDDSKDKTVNKLNTDVYYVYKMTNTDVEPDIKYPIGVFIKFLYREEIIRLQHRGLSVKYYIAAKFKKTDYPDIDNKFVTYTDVPITYTRIKNCTADNFVMYVKDYCGYYHMATNDDFNYEDGLEIDLS